MGGKARPQRATTRAGASCRNLYRFIRLCLGDEPSDREIARQWGMEWKSFAALKHGQRRMPRLDELGRLATRVLRIDAGYVYQAASGVTAEDVAAELMSDRRAGGQAPGEAAHRVEALEAEIDRNQRLLQAVYDEVPAACISVYRDGTILTANARVDALCPATAADMIGRDAVEIFGDPGPTGCPVTRAFLTGRTEQQVSLMTNRRGEEIYVHRVAGPVIRGGRVERVTEMLVDVTAHVGRGDLRIVSLWHGEPGTPGTPRDRDRRASPRARTSFTARYKVRARRSTGSVCNLSAGGMFLEAPVVARGGEEIAVEWTLPGDERSVRTRGVIAWTRRATSGHRPAGAGIRFVTVEPGFAPIAGRGGED